MPRYRHFARSVVIHPATPPSPGSPPFVIAADVSNDLDRMSERGWDYVGVLTNEFSHEGGVFRQSWLIFRQEVEQEQ